MAKIRVLPPEEARRIAAGEVVDRPSALVREFLDNALDAGARAIDLSIEEGGIRLVEVADDGSGMDRDDLALCVSDHATSKIASLEDLSSARTLGFRGEALAAAGAVAELEIVTSPEAGIAWLLCVRNGRITLEGAARARGTTVRARFLFDSVPARKRFLKRPASEALLCKQVLLEKAAAFPDVQFRFIRDGELKVFLPAHGSLKERFAAAFGLEAFRPILHEIAGRGEGFVFSIVAGGPGLARQDKKLQMIFANGRRIYDWGLLQAFEFGLQGGFPNGEHPCGAVFLDIDPALVDFNIHPAKREAKFQNPNGIHHAVTSTLRSFLKELLEVPRYGLSAPREAFRSCVRAAKGAGGFPDDPADAALAEALVPASAARRSAAGSGDAAAECAPRYGAAPEGALTFVGRLWGIFLLVERGGCLYLVDQHAAHEGVLYRRYVTRPIAGERLLIPLAFSVDSAEDDAFLRGHKEELSRLGLTLEQDAPYSWRLESLPAGWSATDGETIEAVLALPRRNAAFVESWAASCACHTAVREGEYIDEDAALALIREAMALPVHRCPHGRPIWVEISREELLRGVKRL
jgi:DNA mismatch repair protein MutL